MSAATATETQPETPAEVLAAVRAERAVENAAAARQLELAAAWADLHPPESIHVAAGFSVSGCEHEEPLAGPGTPLVAEFCVAELGAVLGISSTAAKRLIGNALELRHRLPRLWAGVHDGQVPAWRARLVAEATSHAHPVLTAEAAGWVDDQVAAVAGKVGAAQLDRIADEAIARHGLATEDPTQDPENGWLHADPRHATLDKDAVSFAGTLTLTAELDLVDGLDLDHTLVQDAATLKALGSTEPLDVRRSLALGNLARTQTSLNLAGLLGTGQNGTDQNGTNPASGGPGGPAGDGKDGSAVEEARQRRLETPTGPKLPAARQLVLHIHLSAAAVTDGHITLDPLGRLEQGQRLLLLKQIQGWCADSQTLVSVKPVIDLNQNLHTPGYAIPDRIRDHVILRDKTCVFPHCTRPARRCQVDHIVPFDHDAEAEGRPQPGPTSTQNLAALCTFHHRLKTHSAWRYTMVEPGVFEWTSPHGHRYRRDHEGTTALDDAGFEARSARTSTNEQPRPPDRD